MIFDAVVCVAPKHNRIALKAIRSLYRFAQPRNVFLITAQDNFDFFEKNSAAQLQTHLLDEDKLVENVDLRFIRDNLKQRIGSATEAGWYFQQFLKMAISDYPGLADYYLIWDADTVLLKDVEFFDEDGSVLVNPKTEHHKLYFDITGKILGLEKQVDYSFVSEHLMVKTEYMKELVRAFTLKAPGNTSWVELILNSIEDINLEKSGFSEYETYGNFVALNYKDGFKCRSLRSTRYGAGSYGMHPDKYDIFSLMLSGYAFVTFENRHEKSRLRILINKAISKIIYLFCQLANLCREKRKAAAELTCQ